MKPLFGKYSLSIETLLQTLNLCTFTDTPFTPHLHSQPPSQAQHMTHMCAQEYMWSVCAEPAGVLRMPTALMPG